MTKRDYQLRVTQRNVRTYLVRRNGKVSYIGANEVPLALSSLAGDDAAELRFALEDATTPHAAAIAVRSTVGRHDVTVEVLP